MTHALPQPPVSLPPTQGGRDAEFPLPWLQQSGPQTAGCQGAHRGWLAGGRCQHFLPPPLPPPRLSPTSACFLSPNPQHKVLPPHSGGGPHSGNRSDSKEGGGAPTDCSSSWLGAGWPRKGQDLQRNPLAACQAPTNGIHIGKTQFPPSPGACCLCNSPGQRMGSPARLGIPTHGHWQAGPAH